MRPVFPVLLVFAFTFAAEDKPYVPAHGLFTLRFGQRHIDIALAQLAKGFVPRMVGQGDIIL